MWLIEGRKFVPIRPMGDYYSHFFSVIAYGLTLGVLLQKYLQNKHEKPIHKLPPKR